MRYRSLNITNATEDVAEVRKITIGQAVEGEVYSATFGFGVAEYEAQPGDTTSNIATGLRAAINTTAGTVVTATETTNTITVTADRAGVPIDMNVQGPSTTQEVVTPFEIAVDVPLTSVGLGSVPKGGSIVPNLDLDRIDEGFVRRLEAEEKAGRVTMNPPIRSIVNGLHNGDLTVAAAQTVAIEGMRITGDVTLAAATSVLTAVDCFFEGALDNTAAGTATLTGGRVIGAKSGTIAHDAGDVGI